MIRKLLDSIHPMFAKGGKFEKLYPLYEAQDTFLYTPGEITEGETHVRDSLDLKRMMSMVIVALFPCIFFALYNTGYQSNKIISEAIAASKAASADTPTSFIQDAPEDSAETTAEEENLEPVAESATNEVFKPEGWRYTVMDWLGVDYTQAGTFYGDLFSTRVIACLIHGLLFFLPVYIVCMAVGGTCELIFSIIRGHEINEGFLVTGMLFPLTLPPSIPLWEVGLGIAFGVIIGKEIFGGTGMNFLNVALTARAFLYFSHAPDMSGMNVWTGVDGYSGATSLGAWAEGGAAEMQNLSGTVSFVGPDKQVQVVAESIPNGLSWWDAFIGNMHGSMGETSTLACLIGAVILIGAGIGSWRIMASVVAGMGVFSVLLNVISSSLGAENVPAMFSMGPQWHLVLGGFAFGTVFMATDPVSASMTNKGKYIYGFLIGFMTVLVRCVNPAFPEGIMLAILFGNVFAPLIDYFVVQANIKRRMAYNAT
jgi:Na+-transporting NADH:ubiquinone oxidoreductase subunit B